MLRRRLQLSTPSILGANAVGAVVVVPAMMLGSTVFAQTLSDPSPQAKWTPPPSAKSRAAEPAKRCSAFGPGFVNVPGSDACVKVGGWVTIEGGASR
jgi:Porin subfamily